MNPATVKNLQQPCDTLVLTFNPGGDGQLRHYEDDGMSQQLARMLKQAGQSAPESKPVLEVNPEHALVKKLDGSVHFHDLAHILFDQALLAEGGLPEDPAAYVRRVNALLV